MSRAALYAILFYAGLVLVFVAMYLLGSTQFDLPKGPPIFAAASAAVAYLAMEGITRLRRR